MPSECVNSTGSHVLYHYFFPFKLLNEFFPFALIHVFILNFFTLFLSKRFRGELFGLGTNHTKYKAKNYAGSNGTGTGGGGGLSGGSQALSGYGSSVHYGSSGGGYGMYDDQLLPEGGF